MSVPHVHVAIIGSGVSGLAMAAELQDAGIDDFVMLERAESLGGTWRDNHYPGCACDIPSHLYSFSYAPKPDWSRAFAPQPEIRAYLEHVARARDLLGKIRFGQNVVEATWDDEATRWSLRTAAGDRLTATCVVSAIGGLSNPAYPAIAGRERFAGAQFHSARWDHAFDLRGKRVAVIGTGASAIQFVPQIQPLVARMFLCQRTPPWILPRPDRAYSRLEQRAFTWVPGLRWLYRQAMYWRFEGRLVAFTAFPKLMAMVERDCLRHMAHAIPDPALRERLTPKYHPGCKRILISNDFYPAVAQANVELVDAPIERIEEDGIVVDGRTIPVDAIIYGTGFTVHDYLGGMIVRGRDGERLDARWRGGAEAYLGTTIAGFPNLFMLMGPNTGLGHNSMIVMIEGQAHYAAQTIAMLGRRDLAAIEVRAEVEAAFNTWLQGRLGHTVWSSGCRSWYLDERGKNTTLWPTFATAFRLRTARPRARDYHLRPRDYPPSTTR